jgi:spore germination protein KC
MITYSQGDGPMMKGNKVLKAMLAVFLLSLSIGCSNRRELNDLAITVGLGIDKMDTDQYRVSAQVVEPGEVAEKSGHGRSPAILYSETGATVMEALRKMTKSSPRKMYLAHLRVLIIDERLARDGINEVVDVMFRGHELRTDFYVAIAKGRRAEEILKVMTPLEKLPAVMINKAMDTSQKVWAPSLAVTIDKLIADLISDGKNPVLASVELKGDVNSGNNKSNVEFIDVPAVISSSMLAAFKGDKLRGWLNEDESKGHNYIVNKITSTIGYLSCPKGGKIAVEVVRSDTKVKTRIEDGDPIADIEVRIKQNVSEVSCKIDLTKMETIAELDDLSNKKVKSFIVSAINKAQQQLKSDIFGIGQSLHRTNPKEWKKLQRNWDEHFSNMQINVEVKAHTTFLGTITTSLQNNAKE